MIYDIRRFRLLFNRAWKTVTSRRRNSGQEATGGTDGNGLKFNISRDRDVDL